mgnify:CR=1 FL=1
MGRRAFLFWWDEAGCEIGSVAERVKQVVQANEGCAQGKRKKRKRGAKHFVLFPGGGGSNVHATFVEKYAGKNDKAGNDDSKNDPRLWRQLSRDEVHRDHAALLCGERRATHCTEKHQVAQCFERPRIVKAKQSRSRELIGSNAD